MISKAIDSIVKAFLYLKVDMVHPSSYCFSMIIKEFLKIKKTHLRALIR